jgi:hypothetical protein
MNLQRPQLINEEQEIGDDAPSIVMERFVPPLIDAMRKYLIEVCGHQSEEIEDVLSMIGAEIWSDLLLQVAYNTGRSGHLAEGMGELVEEMMIKGSVDQFLLDQKLTKQ